MTNRDLKTTLKTHYVTVSATTGLLIAISGCLLSVLLFPTPKFEMLTAVAIEAHPAEIHSSSCAVPAGDAGVIVTPCDDIYRPMTYRVEENKVEFINNGYQEVPIEVGAKRPVYLVTENGQSFYTFRMPGDLLRDGSRYIFPVLLGSLVGLILAGALDSPTSRRSRESVDTW